MLGSHIDYTTDHLMASLGLANLPAAERGGGAGALGRAEDSSGSLPCRSGFGGIAGPSGDCEGGAGDPGTAPMASPCRLTKLLSEEYGLSISRSFLADTLTRNDRLAGVQALLGVPCPLPIFGRGVVCRRGGVVSFGAQLSGVSCEVMVSVFVEMADRSRGEKMRTSSEASPARKRGSREGRKSRAFNVGYKGCEVIDASPSLNKSCCFTKITTTVFLWVQHQNIYNSATIPLLPHPTPHLYS